MRDGLIYDLLDHRAKRSFIDSGSILFAKGMKAFVVEKEGDVRNVVHVAQRAHQNEWKECVVCLATLSDQEGQTVGYFGDDENDCQ